MTHEAFGNISVTDYETSFRYPQDGLNLACASQVLAGVPDGGVILDVGFGFAALEKDLARIDPQKSITVLGVEPEEQMVETAYKVAKALEELSNITFIPKIGSLENAISVFSEYFPLHGVVYARSAHEIRLSTGENFWPIVKSVCDGVLPGGCVVYSDPVWNNRVYGDGVEYGDVVRETKKFAQKILKHSHEPNDYLSFDDIYANMRENDFSLSHFSSHGNQILLDYLRDNGFPDMVDVPIDFMCASFKKKNEYRNSVVKAP